MFMKIENQLYSGCKLTQSVILDTELIKKGILREITSSQLMILIAIASNIDVYGKSAISQQEIMKITGLSKPTVSDCIKELLAFRYNGLPIMISEKPGAKKKTIYYFNINTEVHIS